MIRLVDIPRREAAEIVGFDDQRAVAHVTRSERFIGVFWDEEVLGVFGGARAHLLADEGYIWFAPTAAMYTHRRAFARASTDVPDLFYADYSLLYGVCVQDRSARWLRWLGAKFVGTSPDGDVFVFRRPTCR